MPRALAFLVLALLGACRTDPTAAQLEALKQNAGAPPPPLRVVAELQGRHRGPPVAGGASATMRFVRPLHAAFDAARALETVAFADGFYREPANEGFDAVIDDVAASLRAAGFGASDRLLLEVIETVRETPAWTPRRARIALIDGLGKERVLHAFEKPADRDRTCLPRNAPSADVAGPVVLRLEDLTAGAVLATKSALSRSLVDRAQARGAALVVSASLADYNVDPTGAERHLDAVQYVTVRHPSLLPVAQISPHSFSAIEAAVADGAARVAFTAEVEFAERPLRTLVATIVGAKEPELAIAIAAHVQEPGACDNASGVATTLEGARAAATLIGAGTIEAPSRSLVFLFGDEMEQSRVWLAAQRRKTVAAISADMTGESRSKTGAIALLERTPDPGALALHPPDEHSAWGATPVTPEDVVPTGIAVVARSALLDVGALEGGWDTAEHPYEGGSDHDVFLDAGIPAVLFWHFTDFAYHTSLDRLEHVDPAEMKRTGVAILATALALADPKPADLDRHLQTLKLEQELRVRAAEAAHDMETVERWRAWTTGARMWLRQLCLPRDADVLPAGAGNPAQAGSRP